MIKKFAFITEGDVFAVWTINTEDTDQNSETTERIIAGMMSDPIVVEVPENINVQNGWTWDGTEFTQGNN